MSQVYILRNQHNEFFDRSGAWTAGADSKALYRAAHKDEAVNQTVEIAVKHPDLRVQLVVAQQDASGKLMIDGEQPISPAAGNGAPKPAQPDFNTGGESVNPAESEAMCGESLNV